MEHNDQSEKGGHLKTTELVSQSLDKLRKIKSEVSLEIQKSIASRFLELDPKSFNLYAKTYNDRKPNYDRIEGLLVTFGQDFLDDDKPDAGIVITKDGIFKFRGGRNFGFGQEDGLGQISHISGEYWDKKEPFTQEDFLKYGKLCAARIDEHRASNTVKK